MSIIATHKNVVTYLEYTRVVKADEKVSYLKENKGTEYTFALPYGNMAVLLLGPGSSITHGAMQRLTEECCLVGFTGGSGFPIFCGSLSEYRTSEYVQQWLVRWQDPAWRVRAAKYFQEVRTRVVREQWLKYGLSAVALAKAEAAGERLLSYHSSISDKTTLLSREAEYAKALYQILAAEFGVEKFTRQPKGKPDYVNELIDTHNYYAYGLAGTALWVLGIPYAFSVLHGDTRRGALVFDVADMIKDGVLLPLAFQSARDQFDKSAHKRECAKWLQLRKVLPLLFDEIKNVLEKV